MNAFKHHQVVYVPERRNKRDTDAVCAIYIVFDDGGSVKSTSLDVPRRSNAPWIPIHKREYDRLTKEFGLRPKLGRPPLDPTTKRANRLQSSRKWNRNLTKRRKQLGIPMRELPLGARAPKEDVEQALRLLDSINPEAIPPRLYTAVEVALLIGRSPSFVSRVKNSQRRRGRKEG